MKPKQLPCINQFIEKYFNFQCVKLKPTNLEAIWKGQSSERIRYFRDNQLDKIISKMHGKSEITHFLGMLSLWHSAVDVYDPKLVSCRGHTGIVNEQVNSWVKLKLKNDQLYLCPYGLYLLESQLQWNFFSNRGHLESCPIFIVFSFVEVVCLRPDHKTLKWG